MSQNKESDKTSSMRFVLFFIVPLMICANLPMDIYLPFLPIVGEYFNTTPDMVQLSIGVYMTALGVCQLIFGPLSDRHDRKKILISAIVIYIICSYLISITESMIEFLVCRALQAFAASGIIVSCYAMIRDSYEGSDRTRAIGYLNALMAIVPVIAPPLGLLIGKYYGWQGCFDFIVLFALYNLINVLFFLDTPKQSFSDSKIFKDFTHIIKNKKFRVYTLSCSLEITYFIYFISITPFVVVDTMGLTEADFTYVYAVIAAVFAALSFIVPNITEKYGEVRAFVAGHICMLLSAISIVVLDKLSGLTINNIVVGAVFWSIGASLIAVVGNTRMLEPFKNKAGSATAIFGAIELGATGVTSYIIMYFTKPYMDSLTIFMAVPMFLVTLIMMGYLYKLREHL